VLQSLPATEIVEDVHLFATHARDGTRGEAAQRVAVDANALIFSYEHQVMVVTG
jgi:hypothetical protein